MTRWLVTGAGGMLGQDLLAALGSEKLTAATRAELDITDPSAITEVVDGHDIVVNCAGLTNVDAAENAEERFADVNGHAVSALAAACASRGARLIQISSDYVFDGARDEPYPEDAPTGPLNAYGRSKLLAERAVLGQLPGTGYVVRAAWLYADHGANFVRTMLRLAGERDTIDVVDDQHGQPTWTVALAAQLRDLGLASLAGTAPAGTYHGTSSGRTTWFGLARATFEEAGLDPDRIRPITSDRFVRPAARPTYSVLGHQAWSATPVAPLGPWREMLSEAFTEGLT